MEHIESQFYEQEFKILQSELLSNEAPFLNKEERICGKFSVKVVNNIKNCIVIYLNRLIHGLMSVSKEFTESNQITTLESWPSPPNLLSFKIGDLLRCRIASHEKEILKLYEEIMHIS